MFVCEESERMEMRLFLTKTFPNTLGAEDTRASLQANCLLCQDNYLRSQWNQGNITADFDRLAVVFIEWNPYTNCPKYPVRSKK